MHMMNVLLLLLLLLFLVFLLLGQIHLYLLCLNLLVVHIHYILLPTLFHLILIPMYDYILLLHLLHMLIVFRLLSYRCLFLLVYFWFLYFLFLADHSHYIPMSILLHLLLVLQNDFPLLLFWQLCVLVPHLLGLLLLHSSHFVCYTLLCMLFLFLLLLLLLCHLLLLFGHLVFCIHILPFLLLHIIN